MTAMPTMLDWADFPDDFAKFELDPTGCELWIEEIGPGVYALMSSLYNVDNAGFVVGDNGVLAIDAHICVAMADQILAQFPTIRWSSSSAKRRCARPMWITKNASCCRRSATSRKYSTAWSTARPTSCSTTG